MLRYPCMKVVKNRVKEVYMKKASISVPMLFALLSSVVIVNAGTTPKTVNVTASVSQVRALTAVPTLTTTDVTATSSVSYTHLSDRSAYTTDRNDKIISTELYVRAQLTPKLAGWMKPLPPF